MSFNISLDDSDLPVLSIVATQAMTLIEQENATAGDLERLIRGDASLASRVLRLANSPVYGGKVKIASISQAVVRLGMTQLKNTILMAAMGAVFDHTDPIVSSLWKHSIATSMASRWLAEEIGGADPEDAFVAGLLHDVGKIHIYNQEPDAYRSLIEETTNAGRRFYAREHEVIEFTSHESVGALLARKWQLTNEIIEVIRFHHEIEDNPSAVAENQWIVALVATANLLANHLDFGSDCVTDEALLESAPAVMIGFDDALLVRCRDLFPELVADQLAAA